MLRIRLRRVGSKKRPSYRITVAPSTSPRDGRFVEIIGHYDPRQNPEKVVVYEDRALFWLSQGAQPSDPVARFFDKLGLADKLAKVRTGTAIEEVAAPRPTVSKPAKAPQRDPNRAGDPEEAKTETPAEAKPAKAPQRDPNRAGDPEEAKAAKSGKAKAAEAASAAPEVETPAAEATETAETMAAEVPAAETEMAPEAAAAESDSESAAADMTSEAAAEAPAAAVEDEAADSMPEVAGEAAAEQEAEPSGSEPA